MINFNGLKVSALSTLALGAMLISVQPSQAGQFRQNHPRRAEVLGRDNRMNGAINRDRGQLGGNYQGLKQEQRGIRQQERLDAQANGGHITRQEQRQLNGEENTLHQQVAQDYNGQGNAFGRGHGRGGWGGNGGGGNGGGGWGGNGGGGGGWGGNGGGGNGGGGWGGNGGGNGGQFAQNHPRRAEVLGRDGNLNRDINQDRGQLGGNYQALKADDRSIRRQEQDDARANGGYITQQQKQQLNQEENQLHNQIRQDHN